MRVINFFSILCLGRCRCVNLLLVRLKNIYMLSFKFSFELNEQKYVATATPFEKDDTVIYDISTPGKIFTIKGVLLKNDEMEWIDYYSSESTELSKAAGIAIQSIINGKSKY